jgi:hypothetical protein
MRRTDGAAGPEKRTRVPAAAAACVLLAVSTGAAAPAAPAAERWFVSTRGNDGWSGRLAAPDGRGDGPFETLERARDEIRRRKRLGTLAGPVMVSVRAGVYRLDGPLVLTAADSGEEGAPAVWRGYGNERPVISGGRAVTGWTPRGNGVLSADLSAQGRTFGAITQLFFNRERQIPARYPNVDPENPAAGGWATVDGTPVDRIRNRAGDSRSRFTVRLGDTREWARPADGEVVIFPRFNWINDIVRIRSYDRETRTIVLAGDCSYAVRPGDRYCVQGLPEELDAPGEWCLDRAANRLLFRPPSPPEDGSVEAPVLKTLVELNGASHVLLRGFDLECCEGTAVVLNGATDCRVAGCAIRNAGGFDGSGVEIRGGSRCGVVGCDIGWVGRDGIRMAGGDRRTLTGCGHFAENNVIHHTGCAYKQGTGIELRGVGCRASRNLIHDTPRMGILFGGNNLVIEGNEIRHVCLETEDAGAVCTDGRDWISSRGSAVRGNYIHDAVGFAFRDGRWTGNAFAFGIYLDDTAGGVDVTDNAVIRCSRACLRVHNGRDNRIEGNLFALGGEAQVEFAGWTEGSRMWRDFLPRMSAGWESVEGEPAWAGMRGMRTRPGDAALPDGRTLSGNRMLGNILYAGNATALVYRFSNVPFERNDIDSNWVWNAGLAPPAGRAWREDGRFVSLRPPEPVRPFRDPGFDANGTAADPGFVSPAKDDWRLQSGSPALRLGFRSFSFGEIGPYADSLRASWPVVEAPGARERKTPRSGKH